MKGLKAFAVDILGLKLGEHSFEYTIEDEFFTNFEYSPVSVGSLVADVKVEKTERMITFYFKIEGKIELVCDRSMDEFLFPVAVQKEVVFKYGEEEKELGEDVYQISWDAQQVNLGQYLYEFIALAIPMKILHPRFLEEETFEDELIYTAEADHKEEEEQETLDPRWEALKQLKKDKET